MYLMTFWMCKFFNIQTQLFLFIMFALASLIRSLVPGSNIKKVRGLSFCYIAKLSEQSEGFGTQFNIPDGTFLQKEYAAKSR